MKLSFCLLFALLLLKYHVFSQDTLYFRLSNPWNTVKNENGKYLRKCVKENDYLHVWDFNDRNILVTESYYSDTSFKRKLFCHKYFNEIKGYLEQTRCYENGRLHGYSVSYNEKGDTSSYSIFDNSTIIKSWNSDSTDGPTIFSIVEQSAEFPGGRQGWLEYLSRNLYYPSNLYSIKGEVIVRFVVNPVGKIENAVVIKSLHPTLDKEAIRVVKKSPRWKPAVQNGKKVPATITQPISFR